MEIAIIIVLSMIIAYLIYRIYNMHEEVKDARLREEGLDEIEQGYQAEIMDVDDRADKLEERLHNVYEAHRLLKEAKDAQTEQFIAVVSEYDSQIAELQQRELNYQEQIENLRAELDDVRQTALDMQIDLTLKDS